MCEIWKLKKKYTFNVQSCAIVLVFLTMKKKNWQ